MRKRCLVVLIGVVLGGAVPSSLLAGSISDFKDSVDQGSSSGSEDDESDDARSHGGYAASSEPVLGADCYEWAEDPEDCVGVSSGSHGGDLGFGWLLGVRPGWALSLGTSPYRGRYDGTVDEVLESDRRQFAARGYDIEMSGDYHLNQVTARISGLSTWQLDGGGVELFVKHTSSRTPGFGLKYSRLHDFDNGERLGLLRPTYEPNLVINEVATMSLNLGWSLMLDQRGIFAHGPSSGLGLEVFPGDPVMFEVRGGVDVLSGVVMPHVRGALGLFATDRVAFEVNAQHMQVTGGTGLSTMGVGVRVYQGW